MLRVAEGLQGLLLLLRQPLLELCPAPDCHNSDVTRRFLPDPGLHDPQHDACHGDDPVAQQHRPVHPHRRRLLAARRDHALPRPAAHHRGAAQLQGPVRPLASDVQRLRQRLPHDEALGGHLGQIRRLARTWSLGKGTHRGPIVQIF